MEDNKLDDKVKVGFIEVEMKAGRTYKLCTCACSKILPFCDNSHREFNEENGTSYKSMKICPKTDIMVGVYSSNWKK